MRLCTVLARGGSRGVPSKNIRLLKGKPLIAHTLIRAKEAGIFDAIAVSSDSKEILSVASDFGINLLIERPGDLASDTAPKIPAVQHAVIKVEEILDRKADIVCDLDPTSPFRTKEDILAAVKLLESSIAFNNVITAAPSRKSPYFNIVELDGGGTPALSKSAQGSVARR